MPDITCPYCDKAASFVRRQPDQAGILPDATDRLWCSISTCPSCTGVVVFGYTSQGSGQPTTFMPNGSAKEPDSLIPAPIRVDLFEARRCMTVSAYKAAVAMCRRALQGACIDNGATAPTLYKQIEEVVNSNRVHASLKDWADAIRLVGNSGAHPGEDGLETVSAEEAEDMVAFTEQFLDLTYVVSAKVQQRLAARRAPRP